MPIAVIGATGTLGRHVVSALERRGAEVRRVSRSAPDHPVELRTGEGLEAALEGCHVVVDASNGPPSAKAAPVLVDGTRRLLDVGRDAGVRHHVCASIVGCDRVPTGYYRVKVAQEQAVERGQVPWTIVRSTQFHELLARLLALAAARLHVVPMAGAPLQPVAAREAAEAVAAAALGEPVGRRLQVAGPEVRQVRDLARAWWAATRPRAVPVPLPLVGPAGAAMRRGELTAARPDVRGVLTFEDWLAEGRR